MKKAIIFYKGEEVCKLNFDNILVHERFGFTFLDEDGIVTGQFSLEYAYIVLCEDKDIE
jgi:hypothetical protein